MLPPAARLTRREDFAAAVRRGRRAARGTVVAHWVAAGTDAAPRAGFVVSKAVGNAVVRHRVQRRLRHLMRDRIAALPAHSLVVVRAVPAAASATSDRLGEDLDQALRAVLRPPAGAGREQRTGRAQ